MDGVLCCGRCIKYQVVKLVAVFCKMSSNNGSKMARAKRGEQFQK